MSDRFQGLKKIPAEPALRMLSAGNVTLESALELPATAGAPAMMEALQKEGALIDLLRLISVALPPRERTWWACLAARDLLGPEGDPPPPLAAAEAWVFRPSDETRAAVAAALDFAEPGDDTALCASVALYADGTLGVGAMKDQPAPAGAAANLAFAMNIMAVEKLGEDFEAAVNLLIDRALDIARGGNGRVERAEKETA